MRAEQAAPASPPSQPKKPFPKVPTRPAAPVKLAALNALASRGAAHATTAQALQEARAGHAATASELQHAQAEHAAHARALSEVRQAPDHVESRFPHGVRERLAQALEPSPAPAVPWPSGPTSEGGEATAPASRVDSALKLVERIEVFLRAGQPQLELSVGGAFQAEVLLERTGPREVAVTVRGKNGPPPPQELARLREELRRRGLKLSSLGIR